MYGAAILTGACGKSKGERRRGQGRRGGSFLHGKGRVCGSQPARAEEFYRGRKVCH